VSPLLQRRLAECNQTAAGHAGPVINFNIPPDLFGPFRAHAIGEVHVPPGLAQAPAATADQGALIPAGAKPGPDLSLDDFCTCYSLSDDIRKKLDVNGYTGTETLSFIVVAELKEMDFKFGEIAAMKAAMCRWSVL
jgi:hypothetical protein